ncbi:MAG TPA: VanW family protein [Clostridiaceae bacterium]
MLLPIDTKISSYVTDFSSSSLARAENIKIASRLLNGKVLLPGDEFSFNNCIGERTLGRGFKIASILTGNKVDSGIGGGICQLSSTLYNAL